MKLRAYFPITLDLLPYHRILITRFDVGDIIVLGPFEYEVRAAGIYEWGTHKTLADQFVWISKVGDRPIYRAFGTIFGSSCGQR